MGGRVVEEVRREKEDLKGDIHTLTFILPGEKYPLLKENLKKAGQVVVERDLLTETMEEIVVQIQFLQSRP